MRWLASLWIAFALFAGACTLELSGVGDPDAGERDAGDETPMDAGEGDAGGRDAGPDIDAGVDGGPILDAGPGDAGPPPACDSSDPDLRLCLRFEGDATDGSSYGNDANAVFPVYETGRVGQAMRTGAITGLVVPDDASLDFDFPTIEAWVRIDNLPSSFERDGVVDADGQFSLFVYADGDVRCEAGGIEQWDRGGVTEGVWTHLACVFDTDRIRAYRNGEFQGEIGYPGIATAPRGIWVAENGTSGDDQLDGLIDEVRVWNVPRTAEQIRAEYQRGTP